jgi:hypothetical protein
MHVNREGLEVLPIGRRGGVVEVVCQNLIQVSDKR